MAYGIAELEALIDDNGARRDQKRLEVLTQEGAAFAADLIFCEDNGFELWLGSLEDALSLDALERHNIDGILNCAVGECQLECASVRPSAGGRRRTHARGPSAMNGGDFTCSAAVDDGCLHLDRDQIKALASFDADWYSMMLNRDVVYLGVRADDVAGYAMNEHFVETNGFLAQCRKEGRRVLVHCVAGINRSSAALVAFLCQSQMMKLVDAIELTSRHRGHILSNESFLSQLVQHFGQAASAEPLVTAS